MSRASQELLRSQPAVTSSLAKLEALLGVQLFERATTGTYPTAAGLALLVRTRKILNAVEQTVHEVGGTCNAASAGLVSGITRTQMRCLLATAESKSFSGAARAIGISEASLQRAARDLERNVGCPLFKHTASGVIPTTAGIELSKRIGRIIGQLEALKEEIHRANYPKERCVVVGVLLLEPTILLTKAIRELNRKMKDSRVVVVSGGYDVLLKKLYLNAIDLIIGILKNPENETDICEEVLYRDRYCVVAGRGHPLAAQESVTLEDLSRFDWILPQRGSPRRLAFEQIFSDGGPPRATIETYSLSTIRITLSESDMLTVLSGTEVLSEQRIGLLVSLPFEVPGDGPFVGVTMRRDWKPNDIQAAFIEAIKDASRQLRQTRHFDESDQRIRVGGVG